jgi:thioredoxin family protein/tetratricopeptide repeat protein
MSQINWRKNIQEATNEISGGSRFMFLFFYQPEELGSVKMLEETLQKDDVIRVIERETAPVMINVSESKALAEKYCVEWTPTIVIADEKGEELERWVGYLPAEDFIPELMLATGLADFHLGRLDEAIGEFEQLINQYPKSEFVPEAEYFLGVSKFKKEGDMTILSDICTTLTDKYPDSVWAKKGSIWAHLTRQVYVPFSEGTSLGGGQY